MFSNCVQKPLFSPNRVFGVLSRQSWFACERNLIGFIFNEKCHIKLINTSRHDRNDCVLRTVHFYRIQKGYNFIFIPARNFTDIFLRPPIVCSPHFVSYALQTRHFVNFSKLLKIEKYFDTKILLIFEWTDSHSLV